MISTPIGNLEDMTYRAVRLLNECDYILAEDTRRTGILLKHYNIDKQMVSFNEFSEIRKAGIIIDELKQGKHIALVSDAGTPGISDPGFFIVRECVRNNIPVTPVPGASALLSALVCSGLPIDRFAFYGFLPKSGSKLKRILKEIDERGMTAAFYESPYRLKKTIAEISKLLPGSQLVIARELTKRFEEFLRGSPAEIAEKIAGRDVKGELVILIHPAPEKKEGGSSPRRH